MVGNLLWDLYQQAKISDAQATADRAVGVAHRSQADVTHVDRRVDRVALMCCAMWELLREHTSLTDADLQARMQQIDLRDGREDGRSRPPAQACTECGRTISASDASCMYCGQDNRQRIKISF